MSSFTATAPHIYTCISIRLHISWFKEAGMTSGKMKGRNGWKGGQNIWLLSHDNFPCGDRNKNSHNVVHACHKRRLKWIPAVRGYSWTILSLGDIYSDSWSTTLWLGVGPTPSPCKTTFAKKPQEMQAGRNENGQTKAAYRMDCRRVLGRSRLEPGCRTGKMKMIKSR